MKPVEWERHHAQQIRETVNQAWQTHGKRDIATTLAIGSLWMSDPTLTLSQQPRLPFQPLPAQAAELNPSQAVAKIDPTTAAEIRKSLSQGDIQAEIQRLMKQEGGSTADQNVKQNLFKARAMFNLVYERSHHTVLDADIFNQFFPNRLKMPASERLKWDTKILPRLFHTIPVLQTDKSIDDVYKMEWKDYSHIENVVADDPSLRYAISASLDVYRNRPDWLKRALDGLKVIKTNQSKNTSRAGFAISSRTISRIVLDSLEFWHGIYNPTDGFSVMAHELMHRIIILGDYDRKLPPAISPKTAQTFMNSRESLFAVADYCQSKGAKKERPCWKLGNLLEQHKHLEYGLQDEKMLSSNRKGEYPAVLAEIVAERPEELYHLDSRLPGLTETLFGIKLPPLKCLSLNGLIKMCSAKL